MQELVHADIFFFVTSIAVILVGVGICVVLFYLIRILRNIRDITGRVDEGSKLLAEDFGELRSSLKAKGFVWGNLFSFLKKRSRWFSSKRARAEDRK